MNPDVNGLLEAASADVREVDFAERAWAGAHRRRSRRQVIAGVAAAAAVAVAVAVGTQGIGRPNTSPPANPAPSISQTTVMWKTALDGTQYVTAPPLGTESTLPLAGPADVPASLDPSATRLALSDVINDDAKTPLPLVVAVFLEATDGVNYADASTFQPVLVLTDGRQVNSGLTLGWVRDSGGNRSFPLSVDSTAIARWVAFPQPGRVVVLDLRTGKTTAVPVPSTSIERVRFADLDTVVASGDEGAWLIELDSATPQAVKAPAGYTGADEQISVDPSKGTLLTSWKLEGLQQDEGPVPATVDSTTGQSLSSNLTAATAVVLYDGLPSNGSYQGILAVPLADPTAPRLLVMGESPARQKVCCRVVGFLNADTPLYTNVTAEGVWLLAWNIKTGVVSRTFLLEANPAVPPVLTWGLNFG